MSHTHALYPFPHLFSVGYIPITRNALLLFLRQKPPKKGFGGLYQRLMQRTERYRCSVVAKTVASKPLITKGKSAFLQLATLATRFYLTYTHAYTRTRTHTRVLCVACVATVARCIYINTYKDLHTHFFATGLQRYLLGRCKALSHHIALYCGSRHANKQSRAAHCLTGGVA